MKNRFIILLAATAAMWAATTQHTHAITPQDSIAALAQDSTDGSAQAFQAAVDRFARLRIFKNASVGVCVRDLATGETVGAASPDQSLVTASTMKTVTSASALELLGKDFRFATEVKTIGKIHGKTLHGNVVVIGGGDPTLGSAHMPDQPNIVMQVVDSLRARGIEHIDGSIIYDESAYPFETFSPYWMTEDLAYDYGPGVHGINFADNLVTVSFDRSGDVPTDFRITPAVKDLTIDCHAVIGDEQDMYRVLNIGPKPNIIIYGTVKRGKKRYSSQFVNPMPAQLLCDSIAVALHDADIKVKHKHLHLDDDADTTLLVHHSSPCLSEIIRSLLDRSDNMFTEAVLRAIAVNGGKEATAKAGIERVDSLWRAKGIDTSALFQRDGSGLARNGRASARFFTEMLARVCADSTEIGVSLPSLMTRLGETGNIGKRIKKSPLCGKIASKSGSMSEVQCYVGYFPLQKPRYTWAILANNWQGTRANLKDEIEVLLLNLFSAIDLSDGATAEND